jgi:hypothetical protein
MAQAPDNHPVRAAPPTSPPKHLHLAAPAALKSRPEINNRANRPSRPARDKPLICNQAPEDRLADKLAVNPNPANNRASRAKAQQASKPTPNRLDPKTAKPNRGNKDKVKNRARRKLKEPGKASLAVVDNPIRSAKAVNPANSPMPIVNSLILNNPAPTTVRPKLKLKPKGKGKARANLNPNNQAKVRGKAKVKVNSHSNKLKARARVKVRDKHNSKLKLKLRLKARTRAKVKLRAGGADRAEVTRPSSPNRRIVASAAAIRGRMAARLGGLTSMIFLEGAAEAPAGAALSRATTLPLGPIDFAMWKIWSMPPISATAWPTPASKRVSCA